MGMLSGVSIGKLLIAGIVPGILWAVLFSINIVIAIKYRGNEEEQRKRMIAPKASWGMKFSSLKSWWPIAIIGAVIFGGIYGGVFTHTEAACSIFILFCS